MITKERCYYQRPYLIGGSLESRTISPWMSLLLAGQNNGLLMRNSELRPPGLTPLPDTNKAAEEKKRGNHVQNDKPHGHGRGGWKGRGRGHYNTFGRGNHYGRGRGYQPNLSHGQGSGCGISFKPQSSTKSVCHRCGMGNHWAKI